MTAGKLTERVAFDKPSENPDGYGGIETGWAEQTVTAASFMFLRGGETVQAARLAGKQPVVITVRANKETRKITTDWRARDTRREVMNDQGIYTDGVYNVRSVVFTPDRKWIEVTAESGVAS